MLNNIFRDLHGAVKADYLSLTELNGWAERFFSYEFQPSFWLVDLLCCSNKLEALRIIEEANYFYSRSTYDYLDAYVGFCFLVFRKHEISFEEFKKKLIIELDGGENADIDIPSTNDINDYEWSDLKRLGFICEQNYNYLFDKRLYLFEKKYYLPHTLLSSIGITAYPVF